MSRPLLIIGSQAEPFPFIVTDFDLSRQENAMIHNIGSDFRISSFGNKVMVKKINGILRNPEATVGDVFRYYDDHCIDKNYGEPLIFNYKSYSAYGYITGMAMALRDGAPGNVSMDFLELERVNIDPSGYSGSEYSYPDDEYNGMVLPAMITIRRQVLVNAGGAVPESMEIIVDPINLSAVDILFSSKLGVVDSKRNIIYYGGNPVQINASSFVVSETADYAGRFNTLVDSLRISNENDASLSLGGQSWPITVMNVSCTDRSSDINYIQLIISAIMPRSGI